MQYQKDFVFLSHNLGKMPRKYEKLNSGLREQVKQKTELPFNFKDTFSLARYSHTHLCSKACNCSQNSYPPAPLSGTTLILHILYSVF